MGLRAISAFAAVCTVFWCLVFMALAQFSEPGLRAVFGWVLMSFFGFFFALAVVTALVQVWREGR